MDQDRIEKEMHELDRKIDYKFDDIKWLSKAMGSIKLEELDNEYANGALATVGDAIIKFVLADKLFQDMKYPTKGNITNEKEKLEKNSTFHNLINGENWIDYAYNDFQFYSDNVPDHEKVANNGHDSYVEAIVAAIYYDSNFDIVKEWIVTHLLPLLEKYSELSNC